MAGEELEITSKLLFPLVRVKMSVLPKRSVLWLHFIEVSHLNKANFVDHLRAKLNNSFNRDGADVI